LNQASPVIGISGEDFEFLRCSSAEGPDPRPRNALDFKILTSTVFGNYFWQTVYVFEVA
jgi:hypothetical protein